MTEQEILGAAMAYTNKVVEESGGVIVDPVPTEGSTNAVSSGGTYTALEGKLDASEKGTANGVAELDANGKVLSSQLPSFVDDVVEGYYDSETDRFYEESTFETVIDPVGGKSWVDISANKSYRWTGTVYVRVDEGVQLGETSNSAFRGDWGKALKDTMGTGMLDTEAQTVIPAINELNANKVPIYKATVDLSSLDQDTYYPVTGTAISRANNLATPKRICVNVILNSGTKPSWSTHDDGFSVTLDVLVQGSSWGAQRAISHILIDTFSSVSGNISPCAYTQMINSSTPVIWCRGGGKYYIYTDYDSDWTVRTSTYAINGQSVSPTTTKPANDMISSNGYFGGISEAAYHVIDSNNSRSLDIRWGGNALTTAAHIAAFSTNGLEIAPMSLATLGWLLNLDSKVEIQNNAGFHNSIYRGKFLGTEVTQEQWDAISAGTFDDMFTGDFWTIGGVNYRIGHFNYWLGTGDTECTLPHVLIVPDTNLYTAKMNDSNVTTGAYVGSKMYTTNLAQAKTTINNAFGASHILNHREYLANAMKATADPTYESAGSWYDSTVELMNERMVYGADVFHNVEVNGAIPLNYTIDKSQLALFALDPSRICNRVFWWLRCAVSAANFAFVGANGDAVYVAASSSFGVRPAFGIKA